MPLADFLTTDLGVFLDDPFAVSATAGATTANVILDQPGEVLANGMVLSTDYTATAKASDFGSLLRGDAITVILSITRCARCGRLMMACS